jgi:hypothetical protein
MEVNFVSRDEGVAVEKKSTYIYIYIELWSNNF